jgi:hypothetical protein
MSIASKPTPTHGLKIAKSCDSVSPTLKDAWTTFEGSSGGFAQSAVFLLLGSRSCGGGDKGPDDDRPPGPFARREEFPEANRKPSTVQFCYEQF